MSRTELAILYPGYAAEDDYPQLASLVSESVIFNVIHTSLGEGGDAHTVEALRDMGESDRLAEAVASLDPSTAAVVWACTSGSFVYGWRGAHDQVANLAKLSGLPASSASLAFVHALSALGAHCVAVAASYPLSVAQHFVKFLADGGFEVVSSSTADIMTATTAGHVDERTLSAMVREVDCAEAEVILIPDTALHTISAVPRLEQLAGKPVLTANQVCAWDAMRLAGVRSHVDAGRIFDY